MSYVLCSAAFVAINTVPWKVNLVLEVVCGPKGVPVLPRGVFGVEAAPLDQDHARGRGVVCVPFPVEEQERLHKGMMIHGVRG